MSIIHVNQIKAHISKMFDKKINLHDLGRANEESVDNHFLTRALSAYALHYLSQVDADTAAAAVTDGGKDNGIDALHYDEREKRLYIIQSKWIHSGTGEPDNGDVKKFVSGIRDLFNLRFDRFNEKVNLKKDSVVRALTDPHTKYAVVLAHTGLSRLAIPSQTDLDDLAAEINDASEVLTITLLNQSDLHTSLTIGLSGDPINLDIGIKSWGRVQEPHVAYYGQLNARQIVEWWSKFRTRLFAKNLRSMLGDTDVNNEIRDTLTTLPSHFWYFNNGITIVAKKIIKTMVGGGDTDFGTFHCEDISIVNGAQTVGAIGKFGETFPEKLDKSFVPIRVISLENGEPGFGETVTRTNNRQNRIESRDFVTLDPEQNRIKTELAIDGVDYHVIRAESITPSEKAFDLVESTTAMACASGRVHLVVQLKREIGKLWDDIGKAPYKELFNATVNGLYVWRCVQVQRKIDKALEGMLKDGVSGKEYGIAIHGNRLIAMMVFEKLGSNKLGESNFNFDDATKEETILAHTKYYFAELRDSVETNYTNAIIPTLFKNLTKCKYLVELCLL